MGVFGLVVGVICIVACAVTYVLTGHLIADLECEIDKQQEIIAKLADHTAQFEDKFNQYMQGEAKDIAEALAKSQKMEQDYYEGFQSILNYSADVAYGRKKSE